MSRIKIGGTGTRPSCNRHGRGKFVLRADGLIDTGWVRPVLFANVASITVLNQYGVLTLTFHLKNAEPRLWRYSLFRFRSRSLSFGLGWISGKQRENVETIHRYLTRQLAE